MEQQYTEFVTIELQKTPATLRPRVENIYQRHLEYSQSNEADRAKILESMIRDYPLNNPENLLLVARIELLRIGQNTSDINQFFRTDGFLTRDYLKQYMNTLYSEKDVKLLTNDPMKFFSTYTVPHEFLTATDLYMKLLKSSGELSTKSGLNDFKDSNLFAARTLLFNFIGAGITFSAKSNTTVPSLINCLRAGFSESTTLENSNKVNSVAVMDKLKSNPNTNKIKVRDLEPFNKFVEKLCAELEKLATAPSINAPRDIPLGAIAMVEDAQTGLKEAGKFSRDLIKYEKVISLIERDQKSSNPLDPDYAQLKMLSDIISNVIKQYEDLKSNNKIDPKAEPLIKLKIENLVNKAEMTGSKLKERLDAHESMAFSSKDRDVVDQFNGAISSAKAALSPPNTEISAPKPQ